MILTRELVLRIEERLTPTAELVERRAPDGFARACFGATVATRAHGGAPANKVYCFGHADLHHLPAILAFYNGAPAMFCLSPARFSPEVAAALARAGLRQTGFEQAMLFTPPPARIPPPPPAITIERVRRATLEDYLRVLAGGFEWPPEWRDLAIASTRRDFRSREYHFLARYDGEPAGVGSLNFRQGIANLGGGAVLPAYRNRGIHLALVWHRLRLARRRGCEFIQGGASFASPSFRNQSRAGLQLAYLEATWE